MNKMFRQISFLLFIFIIPFNAMSQDDKWFEDMQKSFDEFESSIQTQFDTFVEQNDKQFSDFLREAWIQCDMLEGKEPSKEAPKPEDVPVIDPVKIDKKVDEIKVVAPEQTDNIEVYKAKAPQIQKEEAEGFATNSLVLSFYGSNINLKYDKNFVTTVAAKITPTEIAAYWDKMTATNHYNFVNQCKEEKDRLNLNDFGYYLLVKNAAQKICNNSTNEATLLTWFTLLKSQYKVKLGYNDEGVYLLIPTTNVLYHYKYYVFDGMNYYMMGKSNSSIFAYKNDYADAKRIFDMNVTEPVNLAFNQKLRDVKFNKDGKDYDFKIKYNENSILFYNDYPQGDIKIFFDAAIAPATKVSLIENLKPIIKDMNELDAANFLLSFVQTGFAYKTDNQQFNREKFFFPEEVFFYPYCDCEDRSVLFAYLVKEMIGLEVVGVSYPGHMATAVKFNGDYGLDFFNYKGGKFIISDPTYINAPVGMCMPDFANTSAKIIELENIHLRKSRKEKIWDEMLTAGGYPSGKGGSVVFDDSDNAYITGYFSGTLSYKGQTLTTKNDRSDIFIAKLDNTNKLLWMKNAGGEGADYSAAINKDKSGAIYIAGMYNQPIKFESTVLKSNGLKDVFIAKYDANGSLIWANRLDIEKPDLNKDHIYVSRFNANGEHKSTILFDETGSFSDYGIAFDDENNVFVTLSYSATDGGALSESFDAAANFNFVDAWINYNTELTNADYISPIAGLFAFIKAVKVSGTSVSGQEIITALDKNNSSMRKAAPTCYANIANIERINNTGGVITITTKAGKSLVFDEITISNNAKLKVTTYTGGNAQVNVLSGVNFGKSLVQFVLNHVKLDRESGNLLFDYDSDHSQKELNLKSDLLK